MNAPAIREQIAAKLDALNERELGELLRYIETMQTYMLPVDYDEDSDPSVGFFSAEPDFASRTEEILGAGFGRPQQADEQPE